MRYFIRGMFSRSLVWKKIFGLIWQEVFKYNTYNYMVQVKNQNNTAMNSVKIGFNLSRFMKTFKLEQLLSQ